jgi:hypothetical protein
MGVDPALMWNVRGTLTLLLGPDRADLVNGLSSLFLALAAVMTLWLWRGHWQPGTPDFDLRLALTLLLGLISAPHLNPHDGLLLALPAVLGYRALRQDARQRRPYAAFLLACPLVILTAEWTVGGSLGIRVPVLAALALTIWIALALWHQPAHRAKPLAAPIMSQPHPSPCRTSGRAECLEGDRLL